MIWPMSASVFPAAAHANRPIFYDKQGNARSIAGVCAELSRRYQVARASAPPLPLKMPEAPPRPPLPIPAPAAEAAANDSLALPIYPELSTDQLQYVVDSIAKFYRG